MFYNFKNRCILHGHVFAMANINQFQLEANVNGIDQKYIFLSQPIVTEEVVVNPLEWQSSIAMKIFLLGQLYKDFTRKRHQEDMLLQNTYLKKNQLQNIKKKKFCQKVLMYSVFFFFFFFVVVFQNFDCG